MRASGYDRVVNDFYREPASCVNALLDVETFAGQCLDPACGGGTIPAAMQARGIDCSGSDIVDRGYGPVADFFDLRERVDSIVSNPPFGRIEDFIRHALDLTTDRVVVLARLALLEGMKRRAMFASVPFARVWVSSKRISMPPGNSDVPASGGSVAFAWFVFEHGHDGPATIAWI